MDKIDCLILGLGYTGLAFLKKLAKNNVLAITRSSKFFGELSNKIQIHNLNDTINLPILNQKIKTVIITFPLSNPRFLDHLSFEKLFYLNTTSVYLETMGHWVSEDSPTNPTHPRLLAEKWVTSQNGTVLRLSGIYGPNRHPFSWIQSGALKPDRDFINLIHVDDIVQITEELSHISNLPSVINLSDGEPILKTDIFQIYDKIKANSVQQYQENTPPGGKRVSVKLLKHLLPEFVFQKKEVRLNQDWKL